MIPLLLSFWFLLGGVEDSWMIPWVSSLLVANSKQVSFGMLVKEVELERGTGARNKFGPTCSLF
jgi:hypothetical protein